jgi:putative membrane-bound dehydrogenase-like protein
MILILMKSAQLILVFPTLLVAACAASAAPPTATDPRLVVELVAREPDIVTPTGVAVDERGRIWVIENHTHQRPASYAGPSSDRVRIFDDFGADGKARKITTWADGFHDTMGISLGKNGDVFVATRSAIYLLHDVQGKGQADEKLVLARLDTSATYPHNGLSGFAIDALGDVYFGLGENFGAPYSLIGRDKTTLIGGGEGGSIYRMKTDGSGLTRIATGFWNPFAMTFDRWGRLFAVDNDPDARGPCRLLHIIQGGDYGYRFKYGRKGIHPFQSWNGELPGTLPMVAGTAEAPSGIIAYESNGLPDDYRSHLLVTSWGDHVIEQFQLEPRGASFGAKKKIVVRGGEDFRPVGIAMAPDGSLIVSDWVDKSYPVHGKGRIWRIRAKEPTTEKPLLLSEIDRLDTSRLKNLLSHPRRDIRLTSGEVLAGREQKQLLSVVKDDPDPLTRLHALWELTGNPIQDRQPVLASALHDSAPEVRAEAVALSRRLLKSDELDKLQPLITKLALSDPVATVRLQAILTSRGISLADARTPLVPLLADEDPFIFSGALSAVAREELVDFIHKNEQSPKIRLGLMLALRRFGGPLAAQGLRMSLADADPAIRRAAVQWIAEEGLKDYDTLLDKAVAVQPITRELFEAWLAAKELLANPGPLKNPSNEPGGDAFVLKVIVDAKQPTVLRALALRMLRPDHPKLKLADLVALVKGTDADLKTEALKTLTWRSAAVAQQTLRDVTSTEGFPLTQRRIATLGLALSALDDAQTRQVLLKALNDRNLARDALRSLRGALTPADTGALNSWSQALPESKDDRDEMGEQLMLTLGSTGPIKLSAPRPDSVAAWRDFLQNAKGDPEAGERVFFHAKGPRCFACHKIDGRGEAVGPDLSRIGAAMNREKLVESILEPSKEIAPAFVTWLVTTRDGKQHTGVVVAEGFDSTLTMAGSSGKRTVLQITDIEDRVAQTTSIMPDNLHGQMTRREFADLLVFLEARK